MSRFSTSTATAFTAFAMLLITAVHDTAEAQRRPDDGIGTVSVCSRYGRGCVSGPTRRGRVEMEVRLPGGTWIGCRRDCRETLRQESVDFFETIRERAPGFRR